MDFFSNSHKATSSVNVHLFNIVFHKPIVLIYIKCYKKLMMRMTIWLWLQLRNIRLDSVIQKVTYWHLWFVQTDTFFSILLKSGSSFQQYHRACLLLPFHQMVIFTCMKPCPSGVQSIDTGSLCQTKTERNAKESVSAKTKFTKYPALSKTAT